MVPSTPLLATLFDLVVFEVFPSIRHEDFRWCEAAEYVIK